MRNSIYTEELKEYLSEICVGKYKEEIKDLLNKKFNLNLTKSQVTYALRHFGLSTELTGHFEEGHIPPNKGLKQTEYMSPEAIEKCSKTRFKKGCVARNTLPVGHIRTDDKDTLVIKISDSKEKNKNWQSLHSRVWLYYHPEETIEKGETVVFANGNKRDFSKDNLIKVTRNELLQLNKRHLITSDCDLTKAGLLKTKIEIKVRERIKGEK